MFTGLVETTSILTNIDKRKGITCLEMVTPPKFDCRTGDSIAVNGCCLTVAEEPGKTILFHVNDETERLTSVSLWQPGFEVNLERALALGSRLGGHLVSGHVDDLAELTAINRQDNGWTIEVAIGNHCKPLVIPKGSICLDGVSLTINRIVDKPNHCVIYSMLIPTTIHHTHFKGLKTGWHFNLELDIMGKYLLRHNTIATQDDPNSNR